MDVIIVGAGGHGQVAADTLLEMRAAGADISLVGFVDDDKTIHGSVLLGASVFGSVKSVGRFHHDALFVAIGDNHVRQNLYNRLMDQGHQFTVLQHPTAIVASGVAVGTNTLISAGVIVSTGAEVGVNVILNTGSTIDHHSSIGDHAHIAPGVHLGGDVWIGTGAVVGIGAAILPRRTVGDWAIVGACALVQRDVASSDTVVGVPARSLMLR